MSLIQEALKRKTEERQRHPEAPPAPPPPEPKATQKPEPEQPAVQTLTLKVPPKKSLILIAIVLFTLQVTGLVYFLQTRHKPAQEQTPVPAQKPEPIQVPAEPVTPAPAPAPAPEPKPEPKPEKQKPPEPEIEWPQLSYSGAAAGGNQVLAIINGRMLSIGDQVQGAKVLQIGKTEVLVEYKGEKRILKVDNQ